jgi:hypothetical protein
MPKKKNPAAVALGRKGGKKRMKAMTKKQRSELGKAAAEKRWSK